MPRRRRFTILLVAAAGVAALYAARDQLLPAPPPWWATSWRCTDGASTPQLDLGTRGGAVVGQLVMPHGDDGKFNISLAVLGGEVRGDTVLVGVEPEPPSAADRPPQPEPALPVWDPLVRPAPTYGGAGEVLYVLLRTAPGHARLYRLNQADQGQIRINRPDGRTSRPILLPADLGKHRKVADLIAQTGGG